MMYQGIDLGRFKKVSGDDKASTLKHSKGHEIKIAHSSLSPAMRDHIAQMPVHMAEGGGVMDPESPEPAAEPAQMAATMTAPLPAASPIPPKPAVMPLAGTVNVNASPVVTPQELDEDDALYADDLAKGHIKPETMKSLFAKKDTVGKIGTIFGLLVGGAGAGLTKQPNALLAMMQKEIDNDLEAQKLSNTNEQNWLRLSQEHELQKAQVRRIGVENELTRAQTGKVPAETKQLEASAKSHLADAEEKAMSVAKTRMQLGILHQLTGTVDRMPPGPAREAASATLTGTITPAVMGDIKQRNEQTAAKLNLRANVRGDLRSQEPIDEAGTGVDFEKLNKLSQLGTVAGDMKLPGGMSPSDVAQARDEAQRVADNRAAAKIFNDSFNKLDGMLAAGKLNPQLRAAEIATLGAELARATAGRYNAEEASAQADGMFPSVKDWGSARDEKHRKAMMYFQKQEGGTPTLDQFKLKTAFPTYTREKKNKTAFKDGEKGPKEGDTGNHNGKPVVFAGGKWTYAPSQASK